MVAFFVSSCSMRVVQILCLGALMESTLEDVFTHWTRSYSSQSLMRSHETCFRALSKQNRKNTSDVNITNRMLY